MFLSDQQLRLESLFWMTKERLLTAIAALPDGGDGQVPDPSSFYRAVGDEEREKDGLRSRLAALPERDTAYRQAQYAARRHRPDG